MTTETYTNAHDYHLGYSDGYTKACEDFVESAPNKILEALRKSGGQHGEGITMAVPMDWDVIRAALKELTADFTNPES